MFTDNIAERYIKELLLRYPGLTEAAGNLDKVYSTLKNCFFNDKILFCAGNGGSAADSEHIVGELMKGFLKRRELPEAVRRRITGKTGDETIGNCLQEGLRCLSLLSHPSLNTAFMNDVKPEMVFAQQLYVLGREGDAILGISTSGNAENIRNAFKVARAKGITTILLTGLNHGSCEPFADLIVRGPATETYRIQEFHLPLYHCLCMMLEEAFYGDR